MKKLNLFLFVFCCLGFSTFAHANSPSEPQLLLNIKTINDRKIFLAQCSGQFAYVAGSIRNGSVSFPDKNSALEVYSDASKDALNRALKLPGNDHQRIAEDFYNSLIAKHVSFGEQFGKTRKASEMVYNLAMSGADKCSNFMYK